MSPRAAGAVSLSITLAVLAPAVTFRTASAAPTTPPQFKVDTIATGFTTPTAMAFLPGGRILVAEKRGRVVSVVNGIVNPTPLWSRENEVLNHHDRGLLGLAVDPAYATNRRVYLLYTVDPDSNGTDNNDDAFGRLISIQVSATDSNVVDYSTRQVLMGVTWRQGALSASPSHTVGALRFGTDGSLLVSIGDGASYSQVDAGGLDGAAFGSGSNRTDPYENIGAFRSQSLTSLCGKVLRLNPANGQGYPSNPYWNGSGSSIRSRVWAYGLRNPFRFCVKPGSGSTNPADGDPGTVVLGDVGWNVWEEMNVMPVGGLNLGWPCEEGAGPNALYQAATPAHNGCTSYGQADNPAFPTDPPSAWHHSNANQGSPGGFIGNCSVGGVFYTGNTYPVPYRNAYFFADYGKNWIRVATFSGDVLGAIDTFSTNADAPVDFATGPDGDVYYISIATSQVRRLRYTGTIPNQPPVAEATASPSGGVAPLTVMFSSVGSSDPDNDPLGTFWTFGDGATSTAANPTHTYTDPGSYSAVLTVNDGRGGIDFETVVVVAVAEAEFPSTPVLDRFDRPDGAIGGAWTDETATLRIQSQQLTQQPGSASTVWNGGAFGPNQEAYIRFNAVTPGADEENLMLAVQGTSWSTGHVETRYDPQHQWIRVNTYAPSQGWRSHGTISGVTIGPGDQLGARLLASGVVQVFKNGVLVGTVTVTDWPFLGQGGRLGLTLSQAIQSRLDDFGGGDVVMDPNTAPTALIVAPLPNTTFAAGDTIRLRGDGTDEETEPGALAYHWQVDLHHNTHVHPSSFVSDLKDDQIIGENHDDGTGVHLAVNLIVTDAGGLSDTATVAVYPDVDLRAGGLATSPAWMSAGQPAEFRFVVANDGRMPSSIFRWALTLDGGPMAQGDTLVAALDSINVVRVLPAPSSGLHRMRVVVDTLQQVVELREDNNAVTRDFQVDLVPADVGDAPAALELSAPHPNPTRGGSRLTLALPRGARVRFAVFDLQGRAVWTSVPRSIPAGRWDLSWRGHSAAGDAVRPGIYLATIDVDGRTFVRRIAVTR